jgi:alkylhydroperoxidase family enzyme
VNPDWSTPSAATVEALAPDAIEAFDLALGVVGTAADPRLLELIRRRIATLQQVDDTTLPALAELSEAQVAELPLWPTSPKFSDPERVALSFVEQFILDVSAVSAADRTALSDALGPAMFGFVQAVYVLDHGTRLAAVTRQLFGSSAVKPKLGTTDLTLWPALEQMMGAVARLTTIDPLTAELVRLRGARAHHCRLCMSRRRVAAAAANPEALEQVDAGQRADLDEAQRVALRLTDAVLLQPATLPLDLIGDVRAAFTPAQTIEIALLIAHNAANKIAVALGADDPQVESGVEYFEIAESGIYSYGLPSPT